MAGGHVKALVAVPYYDVYALGSCRQRGAALVEGDECYALVHVLVRIMVAPVDHPIAGDRLLVVEGDGGRNCAAGGMLRELEVMLGGGPGLEDALREVLALLRPPALCLFGANLNDELPVAFADPSRLDALVSLLVGTFMLGASLRARLSLEGRQTISAGTLAAAEAIFAVRRRERRGRRAGAGDRGGPC